MIYIPTDSPIYSLVGLFLDFNKNNPSESSDDTTHQDFHNMCISLFFFNIISLSFWNLSKIY